MHLQCLNSFNNLLPLPPLARLRPQFRRQLVALTSDGRSPDGAVRARKKENVWSVDNDLAEKKAERKFRGRRRRTERGRGRGRGRGEREGKRMGKRKLDPDSRILVSGSMLMELETVLQTQEPVIIPSWSTFTSSLAGLWKGVGAVFSPFTAELEAVSMSARRENLYDCYTLSRVEKTAEDRVRRRINWVALNTVGEKGFGAGGNGAALRRFEEFEWEKSEVLEEEEMGMEPGLVFFEDGSYSRGPAEIPVGEYDERKYFLAPTFKFEQCLVKGCHKRLRIVHTIEFSEGGAHIQVIRVAVYEEQWVSPSNINLPDEGNFEIKPLSQRKRAHPSDLTGSWKVFEISATPIFSQPSQMTDSPFVYICTETLKKRSLPDSSFFGEEELGDGEEASVMWLPGGATGFVEVKEEGVLCVGAGWYGEEGVSLVMERDYGTDGKLIEVRSKSEVKRRWDERETESA